MRNTMGARQTAQGVNAFHDAGIPTKQRQLQRSMVWLVMALAVLVHGMQSAAQDGSSNQPPAVQTTLAIFRVDAYRRPADDEAWDKLWPALVDALHEELESGAPEMSVLVGKPDAEGGSMEHGPKILRGDRIVPGIVDENPISVYLHGDCTSRLLRADMLVRPRSDGPLGWVIIYGGHIEPFIHVDCERIREVLSTQVFTGDRNEYTRRMAVAIAKVILHEWIHVATQNTHHAKRGIGKAEFSLADLMARPQKAVHSQAALRSEKSVDADGGFHPSTSEIMQPRGQMRSGK